MARHLHLKRPILTVVFASMTFAVTLLLGILGNGVVSVNLFGGSPVAALNGMRLVLTTRVDPEVQNGIEITEGVVVAKNGEWSYCDYTPGETPSYSAELQSVTVDEDILPGSVFAVDMEFKNTGTTRVFSADSGCDGPVLNVGTQNQQDRVSDLATDKLRISGWTSPTRVQMTEPYVDPNENFHVIFQSIAPEGNNVYREFFQPVVEGVAWVGEVFSVDITVGTPTETMLSNISFVRGLSMAASDLEGLARSVEVELSSQMMYARFGENRVWGMQISSGAYDTPTPPGTYKILSKQELRIGGKSPHYRMPYFQLWDSRGYGIHALPYLASDGGTFWSEALTHIGIPVSHGCIRTLPDDALDIYSFTEIGTTVWVH